MPSLTGTVTNEGYSVLSSIVLSGAGYGLAITTLPALPVNPYFGFTFPVLPSDGFSPRFSGSGRKVYRDGVIVIPPYPEGTYDIVVVWRQEAIGRGWYLQW